MSTMDWVVMTVRPRRVSRWSKVKQSFAEWRHCTRSHNELMRLSDRVLQDIGMSRHARDFEASKPFRPEYTPALAIFFCARATFFSSTPGAQMRYEQQVQNGGRAGGPGRRRGGRPSPVVR